MSPLWEVRSENDLLGVTVLLFYFFQIRIVTLKARALYCSAYPPSLIFGVTSRLLLTFKLLRNC